MRGETFSFVCLKSYGEYFNPLPSCEGRRVQIYDLKIPTLFQSTPLMRGETTDRYSRQPPVNNFNPLPSCEGRLICLQTCPNTQLISIHSPHARGDEALYSPFYNDWISIHSPHARGDGNCAVLILLHIYFNPLPSCEGRQGR